MCIRDRFEPEPYRVVEKNGNAVVLENSAGQSNAGHRNAGYMKKFVHPGSEREIELLATSVTTDTPKEVLISEQDPVGGIQQKTQ